MTNANQNPGPGENSLMEFEEALDDALFCDFNQEDIDDDQEDNEDPWAPYQDDEEDY
jgi:hypothetical protein